MHLGGGKCPSPDGGLPGSHKPPLDGVFFQGLKPSSKDANLSPVVRFLSVIPSKLSLSKGKNQFVVFLLLLLLLPMTAIVPMSLFLLREGSQISPGLISNSSLAQYIPPSFLSGYKKDADVSTTFKASRTLHHLPFNSKSQRHSAAVQMTSFHLSKLHKRKVLRGNNRSVILSYDSNISGVSDLKYDNHGNQEQNNTQKKQKYGKRKIDALRGNLDLIFVPLPESFTESPKRNPYKMILEFLDQGMIIQESLQKTGSIKDSSSYRWKRKRRLNHFSHGKITDTPSTQRKASYQFLPRSGNAGVPLPTRILSYYASRKPGNADTPPKPIQHSMPIPSHGSGFIGMNGSSSGGRNVKFAQRNGNGISEMTGISTGSIRGKRSLPALVESPASEMYFPEGDTRDWRTSSRYGERIQWKRFQPSYEGNGLLEGRSEASFPGRKYSLPDGVAWEWFPENERDRRKKTNSTTREGIGGLQIPLSHLKGSAVREKQRSEYPQLGLTKHHLQNEKNYERMYSRNEDGKWSWTIFPLNDEVDVKEDMTSYGNGGERNIHNVRTMDSSFTSKKSSTAISENGKNPGFQPPGVGDSQGVLSSKLWNELKNLENSTSFLSNTKYPTDRGKDNEHESLINTKHQLKTHVHRALKTKRAERRSGVDLTLKYKREESFYERIGGISNANRGDSFISSARYGETPDIFPIGGVTSQKNSLSGRTFMVDEAAREQMEMAAVSAVEKAEMKEKVESGEYQEEENIKGDRQSIASSKRALPGDYHSIIKAKRLRRKIDISSVSVIEGEEAALPCDLRSPNPDDTVQIILWIKEGLHTPLYSYDFRELLKGQPKETKPDANSTLSRRTSFRKNRSPAALVIQKAEVEDGGIYRCRVDFLLSPTVNHRVNLTVVVPPSRVRITWYSANSTLMTASGNEVGPFLVRSQPTLICTSDDGWPPPSVVWLEDDQVLDDSYRVDHERSLVENDLTFAPLSRGDLGRRLTCVASNTNRTRPAVKTVRLELSLRIMGVKVQKVGTIWANERATAICRIWGSRPPPNVLWWLGSLMLPPTETKTKEGNDNITLSYLEFIPAPEDDGAMLICQATNEMLPDLAVQDSTILNVNYAPMVRVHLGRSLDPEKIKEGDDVYFECSVISKPPVTSVIWKHNDVQLVAGSGIILSNMSLVVQGVTRSHGGNYTCHATNSRNTTASPPLHLDVKYTPVCAIEQRQQHSVGKLENAEIACKVDANPRDVTFRWTFNNTAEAIDVPEGRFVVVGTESRVNYTPMNELDYGTLLCWANNSIGMQQYPCVFQIVAAGKPDPPHNCKVSHVTISSLQVSCLPGDNGGLHQTFLLQVYKVGSTSPVTELSQPHPEFSLTNLTPATSYKIVIAAINEKGASRLEELNAYTVKVPETLEETSAEPARDRERGSSLPLALLIGTIVAVVPIVIASVVFVWLRVCRRSSNNSGGSNSEADGAAANSENDPNTHSSHSRGDPGSTELAVSELSLQPEDRDPDIVLQASAESPWPDPMMDIATISAPPYMIGEGENRYPSVAMATSITTTDCGMQYTQGTNQESFCIYPPQAPPGQLQQMPVSAISQVPYKTDCAQHQQDSTSCSPSHKNWYTTTLTQEQSRPKNTSSSQATFQGEEFTPDPPSSYAGSGRDHSMTQAFQIQTNPASKGPLNVSHCSLHRCQDDQNLGLQSVSGPVTICGVTRQGSFKGIAQSKGLAPQALSTSNPAFQSMGDIISQCERVSSRSSLLGDPLTASLNRNRKPKKDIIMSPFSAIASHSCQHLIKTLPDKQSRQNKRESAV